MSKTKAARLSLAALGLSLVLAGCGGPDNEKTGSLTAEGTPTKDATQGPKKSPDELYKGMLNQKDPMEQMKDYPKK